MGNSVARSYGNADLELTWLGGQHRGVFAVLPSLLESLGLEKQQKPRWFSLYLFDLFIFVISCTKARGAAKHCVSKLFTLFQQILS